MPEQRSFLIKHGQDSVIAKLNLSGMSDLIKVLSGRTETVAELELLMEAVGTDPAIWLPIFMGRAPTPGMCRHDPAPSDPDLSAFLGSHALAAVPTRDAAILERRAQESGHKTELKTILLDHKKKREGINCA